jgi:hypothetical protein
LRASLFLGEKMTEKQEELRLILLTAQGLRLLLRYKYYPNAEKMAKEIENMLDEYIKKATD